MSDNIVPILSLITLLAVAVLALVGRQRTLARKHDPHAPVSSLAKDGPEGGVAFLQPLDAEATPDPASTPQGQGYPHADTFDPRPTPLATPIRGVDAPLVNDPTLPPRPGA